MPEGDEVLFDATLAEVDRKRSALRRLCIAARVHCGMFNPADRALPPAGVLRFPPPAASRRAELRGLAVAGHRIATGAGVSLAASIATCIRSRCTIPARLSGDWRESDADCAFSTLPTRCLPVSEESCGGAEQMLWALEAEMVATRPHTVVAACDGSRSFGKLLATGAAPQEPDRFEQREAEHAAQILAMLGACSRRRRAST